MSLKQKKVRKYKKTSFKDGLGIHQERLGVRLSLDYGDNHIWSLCFFFFLQKMEYLLISVLTFCKSVYFSRPHSSSLEHKVNSSSFQPIFL